MKIIKLHKLHNVRDLGGIKTSDGRLIKDKIFIRSSSLYKASNLDIELLKNKYNLKTVIDLRTKREVEEEPDCNLFDINYYHLPILNDSVAGLSHEKKVRSLKSLQLMPDMGKSYLLMVNDECLSNLITVLKNIFESVDDNNSVLFHCTAGKDRTGLISALILDILGVDRQVIINEYLFTNHFTKAKAKFIYIGLLLIKLNHRFAKKIRDYYICRKEYILGALESLETQFGSLDNFYKNCLDFDDEKIQSIRNKFLI